MLVKAKKKKQKYQVTVNIYLWMVWQPCVVSLLVLVLVLPA
jgi:hypothetical protein